MIGKYGTILIAMIFVMFAGCATKQIPLSTETRNAMLYGDNPKVVVPELLTKLKVGMCEHEVFTLLSISHETPNLTNLKVEELYQHVSLLNGRTVEPASCVEVHGAEVPYVGHRLPFTHVINTGYLSGIKWVRRSSGSDWYVDLLFYQGTFLSYSVGGELHRDTQRSAYPWESALGDPFSSIGSSIVP
jgi:hypothetical protein